ncbi:CHASE3 domain-containing protein [Saccharibacillus sp. CPCC 101409]|uniref:CHASE3 domain-containing protein n=1 Tax=Saccharibacillus sp. CPCC 101409 TaxID=3058041 RepID=UPI0026725528|nr:CHASE3 domain-containing protein [Saccharibacillus sp. CPCC 101409]MDO3408493.1 CHASE3 domain-containing protein [Saccharibacillus sp. CPCC 101409]
MPKTKRFNIRTKILAGYLFILVCLGLSLVAVSSQVGDLQESNEFISTHDIKVHDEVSALQKNLLDMETGQRGYLLTGDRNYLEPYNDGRTRWETNYGSLYQLVEDNPSQQTNLRAIRSNIEKWIAEMGDKTIQLKEQGKDAEVLAFYTGDAGKREMDQMRVQFDAFRQTEQTLTDARVAELKADSTRMVYAMLALWVLVGIVSIVAAMTIAGSISKTINRVTNAIRSITAGGDLKGRIDVRSSDEVGDLADSTNTLLSKLQTEDLHKERLIRLAELLQEKSTSTTAQLAEAFLASVSDSMSIPVGAFYLVDEERDMLLKAAAIAEDPEHARRTAGVSIAFGEGLVGRCAREGRMIHLSEVPADYIKVSSALGTSPSAEVLLMPVMHGGRVKAVIEWASPSAFSADQIEQIQRKTELLGSTLQAVEARQEIERLYRESQTLNEELQVQSEELQVQSEEMQTQAQELMTQRDELESINELLGAQKHEAEVSAHEIEKYAEQLQVSSKYKSEFLANMSHELRTPLNSMLILSQILSENSGRTLTHKEEEYASSINASGKDLLSLINDILDLSKVEAGKMHIELASVDLGAVAADMNRHFSETANRKRLDFRIEIEENVPGVIFTDEMRLQQILRNLLSNSFKFTERGEVVLRIARTPGKRMNSEWASYDQLMFSVSDTGIGITEENQRLIFEAFQQADGTIARRYGGTGLGLSISTQLSGLLGGEITLDSRYGSGSTFCLYLPCVKDDGEIADLFLPLDGRRSWPDSELPLLREAVLRDDPQTGRMPVEYLSAERFELEPAAGQIVIVPETIADPSDGSGPQGISLTLAEPQRSLSFTGMRMMIVDDDIRNVYALTSMLENQGVEITVAQTGLDALDKLNSDGSFDMIFMDIMMPELDGLETMRRIRSAPGFSDIPILALTAKAMKEDREKCLNAGASDYLTKPLDMELVLERMRMLLEESAELTG